MTDGCPTEDLLLDFLQGRLAEAARADLQRHLAGCEDCQVLVAQIQPAEAETGPPQAFEEYRLLSPLGSGAMGQVFLAHDTTLDRKVAIKFIAAAHAAHIQAGAKERFLIEARAIARLQHPNVVAVFRVGEVGGRPYLVSEFVPGKSLDQLPLPLPGPRALAIGIALSRGLAAAHKKGVLHRDIKPANVILADDGEVKLLDFGLAKLSGEEPQAVDPALPAPALDGDIALEATMLPEPPVAAVGASPSLTRTGALLGTPHYMPPEAWRGLPASPASDVYSLGALLFELCSGDVPHPEQSMKALFHAVLEQDAQPLAQAASGTDLAFANIVDRCLRRDPEARFASGEDLLVALETCAAPVPAPLRHARRWPLAVAGALVGVLVAGGAAYRLLPASRMQALSTTAAQKGRRSVAFLGFKSLSGQESWLSTALSELLGGELSAATDKLRVLPAESVARMKLELHLGEADSYAKETLSRIYQNLGPDLVVAGSFLALGDKAAGQLRLLVQLQDTKTGDVVASVSDTGSEAEIFSLVSRSGDKLRKLLGITQLPQAAVDGLKAAKPANADAIRLYAQGQEKLRHFDALGARDLLQKAVTADPAFAKGHGALAETWSLLGYDKQVKESAQRAFDLSADLPREDRLLLEARFREAAGERDKAIELYKSLFTFFPDNLDYGLRLAQAQTDLGQGAAALATLKSLRQLPTGDDPRIDLAEGVAGYYAGTSEKARAPLQRAVEKGKARGASLLVAKARHWQAMVAMNLNDAAGTLRFAEEAKAIFTAAGDRRGVSDALDAIRMAHEALGNHAEFFAANDEYLRINQEIGNLFEVSFGLVSKARGLIAQGKLAEGLSLYEQGLAISREAGRPFAIGGLLVQGGDLSLLTGHLDQARARYSEALALFEQIPRDRSWARYKLGELDLIEGRLADARKKQEAALAEREQGIGPAYVAESLRGLSLLAIEEGQPAKAEALLRRALALLQKDTMDGILPGQLLLAQALLAQRNLPEAEQAVDRAAAFVKRWPDLLVRLPVTRIAARVRAASGRPDDITEALRSLEAALVQATTAGFVSEQFELRLTLGDIERAAGKPTARARLATLQKDATQKGFLLIARKAGAR